MLLGLTTCDELYTPTDHSSVATFDVLYILSARFVHAIDWQVTSRLERMSWVDDTYTEDSGSSLLASKD